MYKNDRWPSVYADDGSLLIEKPEEEFEEFILQGAPVSMSASSSEKESSIVFFNPREKQRTIAQGRDFYITGKFKKDVSFPLNAVFIVNVYQLLKDKNGVESKKCCRSVFCRRKDDKEHLYIKDEYKLLRQFGVKRGETLPQFFKEDVKNSCIPDLVFDEIDDEAVAKGDIDFEIGPKSLQWTWNKAYYTDTFFSAIIYGGEYGAVIREEVEKYNEKMQREAKIYNKPFSRYKRPFPYTKDGYEEGGKTYGSNNPQEITSLQEGKYSVEVSVYSPEAVGDANPYGFSSDNYLARGKLDIVIGTIKDKIMATFSYDDHIKRLREIDANPKENKTLMWDPFPGMWIKNIITEAPLQFRPTQNEDFRFGIETDRARVNFNDSVEYRSGTIHFYNYGVMDWSNALTSEFPEIYKQRETGNAPKIITYCYEYGEPYRYDDTNNGCSSKYSNPSSIVELTKAIQYLYAEVDSTGTIMDGLNDRYVNKKSAAVKKIPIGKYNDPVKPGDRISVFGICNLPKKQSFESRDVELAYNDASIWKSFLYDCPQYGNTVVKKEAVTRKFEKKVIRVFDKKSGNKTERGSEEVCLKFEKTGVLEFKHVFVVPKEWAGKHIKIAATAAYASSSERTQIGIAGDGEIVLEFNVS